jgi:integrase/recombinase XerD
LTLAVVRDLREARAPAGPAELAGFETDVLAGFVLARAAAGLSDGTISSDVVHLEQAWVATTMNYVHVPATHIEDAWIAGQQRAAGRLRRLSR